MGYYKEANFKLLANEQLVDTKSDTQEFEKDEDETQKELRVVVIATLVSITTSSLLQQKLDRIVIKTFMDRLLRLHYS